MSWHNPNLVLVYKDWCPPLWKGRNGASVTSHIWAGKRKYSPFVVQETEQQKSSDFTSCKSNHGHHHLRLLSPMLYVIWTAQHELQLKAMWSTSHTKRKPARNLQPKNRGLYVMSCWQLVYAHFIQDYYIAESLFK